VKSEQNLPNYKIPVPTWLETPSIVEISTGHYRALGRVIHARGLKDQLVTKKDLNFDAVRETMALVQQLDILADTIYIEGLVNFHGVKNVKIYARKIVAAKGSKIDFSAPVWNLASPAPSGGNGEDGIHGEHGIDGPQVEVFCDVISGDFNVTANGGNGQKGQDGGKGGRGGNSGDRKPDRSSSDCTSQSSSYCRNVAGIPGARGPPGEKGGNAGRPGNGGNAGHINIRYRKLNGWLTAMSCKGAGAQPANNGQGGPGGAGGKGGRGRNCIKKENICFGFSQRGCSKYCADDGIGDRAASGPPGYQGASGSTPSTKGQDGLVRKSDVQAGTLDASNKKSFPVELIAIMRRQAVDLLLGNSNDQEGRDALRFILSLANARNDIEKIKKDVRRKLGFLGKVGYDIFGKNTFFAPNVKWETLETTVNEVKDAAESYEKAFNDVISSVENQENFKQMAIKMSAVSSLHVGAEQKRLLQAKDIAESEKRLYVKAITTQEEKMTSLLIIIQKMLPDVYEKAKFNPADLLAVLQGIVGFANAIASRDPFAVIDTALGIASSQSGKQCLKSLESSLSSTKKWLTFGKNYTPLKDSSDLDFDQVDVASVPEIMKANLEMNKETFAAELVCLLEVASRPQDIADFKAHIESFFIAGSARIDLIGKVIDLDNDIGGYNFDIPLLEKTQKAIADVSKSEGASISKNLQQTFTEDLLSTYRELERSYMSTVYELEKALKFLTLWKGTNFLASFRRVATESARGTGRLNGDVQLTKLLYDLKKYYVHDAAKCFSRISYTSNVWKLYFDNINSKSVFDELSINGSTKFTINIDQFCSRSKCYNVRLLKIYIELFGHVEQSDSVPAKVYLKVRHHSGSYFRDGNNTIQQYRQPLGKHKNIQFNRFTITNEAKCRESSKYCVTSTDARWKVLCNEPNDREGKFSQFSSEECKSPFGIYDLEIPVDRSLPCDKSGMEITNCKDLDLTKFTKMNVWMHVYYWAGQYPTGPDDRTCRVQSKKRDEAVIDPQ